MFEPPQKMSEPWGISQLFSSSPFSLVLDFVHFSWNPRYQIGGVLGSGRSRRRAPPSSHDFQAAETLARSRRI
jgi:hypothetical protein